ncbi:hypothetical protein [Noviluteimonas dokdonensis]|uniref:hypothetical protein n=1 Tax=Noviluteimonas dokdonensis TaxID=414050 RepID=UPI001269977F|nr:hypothetical protein [Lysobacter dokdonensis]
MTPQDDLLLSLRKLGLGERIQVIPDSSTFFAAIESRFPITGSKVDWQLLESEYRQLRTDNEGEEFAEFLVELGSRFKLAGKATYAGDGLTDVAIIFDFADAGRLAEAVAGIPQHHYIANQEMQWCASLTMEREMWFAFAPCSSK